MLEGCRMDILESSRCYWVMDLETTHEIKV